MKLYLIGGPIDGQDMEVPETSLQSLAIIVPQQVESGILQLRYEVTLKKVGEYQFVSSELISI